MKLKKLLSAVLAGTMTITSLFGSVTTVSAETKATVEKMDLVQHVDTRIGSNNFKGNSEWAGTAPLVSTPFGMTNFTPQTRQNRIGDISYMYRDTKIKGFFATHQPAIWMGDYGYFNVMPQVGNATPDENGRALSFTHEDEIAKPHYYQVKVGENEGKPINMEMTATQRSAIYRFTYPTTEEAKLFVESARNRANGHIEIDMEKGEIRGWNNDNMSSHLNNKAPKNLKGYFVIQFDTELTGKGTYENYQMTADKMSADGQKSGAYLTFAADENKPVEFRIGTSFVSEDQARANIAQEIGDKTFEEVKEETETIWNDKLNVLQIDGATKDENAIFYTAMYHALLYPRSFYETVDGKDMYFSPYDDKYHEGRSYTDFSLWDTFRAQNSLITLVAPEKVDEMVTSLLQTYKEGGYMPKWPNPGYTNIMIGTHADSIVAEAMKKGLLDESKYELAYEAVLKDAMVPQEGDGTIKWQDRQKNVPYEARGGLSAYKKLGYIPNGYVKENGSRTIEFAYDDWCVAQVAKMLGKEDEAKYFLNRSMNYKNMISPETGYAMGRDVEGNWTTKGEEFTESDKKNFTWFAPQDPQGLIDYMTEHKGADFYNVELEKAFGGQGGSKWIDHQNEPSHHYAYMFDFSGRPDLTQKYARQTLLESYTADSNGELGNDDCGQMSSWYVFSAMGFYPANPASGEYMIGSPIFDKVTINNPKTGTQFVIEASNNNDADNKNCYIQSATLNGEALNVPYLTYDQITKGGNVSFVMGNTASDWAKDYKKEAIKYAEDAKEPEGYEDIKPPFFGDSEVTRVVEDDINLALTAKADATTFQEVNDGGPANTLNDGRYDYGYVSANNPTFPQYLTYTWDKPQSFNKISVFGNYGQKQGVTKFILEATEDGETWTPITDEITINWKTNNDPEQQDFEFDKVTNKTGLRMKVLAANNSWNHFAMRELEVYNKTNSSDKISLSDPVDFVGNIKYNGNELVKVLYNGKELVEGTDYEFKDETKKQIVILAKTLVANGADAGAKIEFVFSQGNSDIETIVIWDGWRANLESLVKKAEAVDYSLYTLISVETLRTELKEAKAVLANENATDEEFEAESAKLNEALNALILTTDSLMKTPGITAKVNAQVKDSEGAKQAIDFNENTKWSCYAKDADNGYYWLEVKFPNVYDVTSMDLLSAGREGAQNITKEFMLQVKQDGEWKTVLDVKENTEDRYHGELAKVVTGDEFRLLIPKLGEASHNNARILEFHLYGKMAFNVDKTDLEVAVDLADAVTEEELDKVVPVVVTEFKAALKEAHEVLDYVYSTQVEVDASFERLSNVLSMLSFYKGDKTDLQALVDAIAELNKDNFTTDSWNALEEALKEANQVIADENALEKEVKAAYDKLNEAFTNLVHRADKAKLQALVDKINGLDSSKYIKSTWDAMLPSLTQAQEVLADLDIAQEKVDAAYEALLRGYLELRLVPDKGLLDDLINKVEELDKADYTEESWDALADALANAKEVYANEEATQEEVEAVYEDLYNAYAELKPVVPTTPLEPSTPIDKGNNGDKEEGTDTGDTSNAAAMAGLMLLAGAVIVSRRRKATK